MRIPRAGLVRITAAFLAVAVFFVIAAVFRPEPVSDFLYYWMIADAPSLYHKGGVVGLLFAPLKGMGIAPYWAAALLNACSAVLAIFAIVPGGKQERRFDVIGVLGALAVVLVILAAAPAAALVATDLMALSAFVVGMRLLMCLGQSSLRGWTVAGALLALALSASLRPIYAPLMIVAGGALMLIQHEMRIPGWMLNRRHSRMLSAGMGILVVLGGLLAANLLERSLLDHSKSSQYGPGVVRAVVAIGHDMGDGKDTCGAWSESRARFGLEHREDPLVPFIMARQKEVGWRHLPALYACKVSRILGFRDWFAGWLQGSLGYSQDRILADSMGVVVAVVNEAARENYVARNQAEKLAYQTRATIYAQASHWIGSVLQIVILLFLSLSTVALARARSWKFGLCALGVALLPAAVLIALHAVFFEVQARYAFPIWVLPAVFMMLIRQASDRAHSAARSGGPASADVV